MIGGKTINIRSPCPPVQQTESHGVPGAVGAKAKMEEATLAAERSRGVVATQDVQQRTGLVHCRQRKQTMDSGHFVEEEGKKEDEGEKMNEDKKKDEEVENEEK